MIGNRIVHMIIFSKISYFFYFHRSFNPQLLFISRLSKIKLTFLGTTFYEQSEIYKYLKKSGNNSEISIIQSIVQ